MNLKEILRFWDLIAKSPSWTANFLTLPNSRLLILLESKLLFKQNALKWFTSYLRDRKFDTKTGSNPCTPIDLQYDIPQG